MKKLLLIIIKFYKNYISGLIFVIFGHECRYHLSCGDYSYDAISKFGVIKGTKISFLRFLSCSRFSNKDYYDPVPAKL